VVGLAGEHAFQGLDGAVAVALGRVDLGERHGGERGGSAASRREWAAEGADAVGRVGEVQAALDDAGEEIARDAEEAAGLLLRDGVDVGAEEQLVDELGPREDARARDAGVLGAGDEGVAVEAFQLGAVHGGSLAPVRERRQGGRGGRRGPPPTPAGRASVARGRSRG
jgi:hypothetical protein